jgi:hypothetical protein
MNPRAVCVPFEEGKKTQRIAKTNEKKRFEMQIRARAINIVFVDVFLAKRKPAGPGD